jgi:hypothetical protein
LFFGAAILAFAIVTFLPQGSSMFNLASSYSHAGRHHDALALQEETLEFLRRVLPENHPKIGAAE